MYKKIENFLSQKRSKKNEFKRWRKQKKKRID